MCVYVCAYLYRITYITKIESDFTRALKTQHRGYAVHAGHALGEEQLEFETHSDLLLLFTLKAKYYDIMFQTSYHAHHNDHSEIKPRYDQLSEEKLAKLSIRPTDCQRE